MDLLTENLGYDVWEIEDIPSNTTSNIYILGKKYSFDELDSIRDDINSIIWCTYRKNFTPLADTTYTTDRGFGCMMRCGQMLLAEALKQVKLGREWRWSKETRDKIYLQIISRFEDNKDAVFGIHQIVNMGQDSGKSCGEWFSPNVIAQVLKRLVKFDDEFSNLQIHVALDHQLATDECLEHQKTNNFVPLLIIIPLRLGLNELNPIYVNRLKKCLEIKSSIGITGGRPNQALYFLGYVSDEILYLDPHSTQRSGSLGNKETTDEIELDETYHQRFCGRMNFSSMDPSIAVSFLCKTRQDFDELVEELQVKDGNTPLFEVIKSRSNQWISASSSMVTSRDLEADLNVICGESSTNAEEFEEVAAGSSEDEFEIIE